MRILVADDDPTLALLIRLTLEGRGHAVVSAQNGNEVLDLAAHELPDVVLLDVMMPELDGFQTLTAIRSDPHMAHLPVVLLSARVGQEDRRRGLESGASDYVTKPFDPDALGELVDELGAMSAQTRAQRAEDKLAAFTQTRETYGTDKPVVSQQNTNTLFSVLDLAVDAIVSIDTSQYIVAFNKGAETVFGYLAEEVLGKPLEVLLPDRVGHLHARHVERFAAAEDTARLMGQRQDIFGRRKDGSEFPAEASIAKIEMDGRQILTAILRDVTQQRAAERELRNRAQQQEAVAELGQIALSGTPIAEVLQQACKLVADVLRVDSVVVMELQGDTLSFVASEGLSVGPRNTTTIERSEKTLASYTLQHTEPVVVPDFSTENRFNMHPVLSDNHFCSGMTVTIKGAATSYGILGIFTKQPRQFGVDDAYFIRAIANTLAGAITRERSEERLRVFLESAPDATVVVDADGRVVSANEQAESLFGYSKAELLELSVDALVPDQISAVHARYRKQFDREPRTRPMGAGLNLVARRKDGGEVPVDILLRPLETDEGRLVVAAVRDVTDRRRSEQVRDAFLHAVSHDLRTPLTGVVGFSTLLKKPEAAANPETVQKYAGLIFDGAKRLETLLGDLLDLDRLARGVIQPQRRQTDLHALVESIAAGLPLGQHPFVVDMEADAVVASVDPAQVERIIENLLVNVIRHCPPEAPVWVRSRRGPNGVLLMVEDGGKGVPDRLKKTLFEPFRRGDDNAASPGSGIGLSLVARFAELHGGRAWIDDRPGGGASFCVLLGEGPATHRSSLSPAE